MSQYLNIYLVPKKSKDEEKPKKPIYLTAFSRSTDVYDELTDVKSFAYYNTEEDFTDLTAKDIEAALSSVKEQIERSERTIKSERESLKHLMNKEAIEDVMCNIESQEEYLKTELSYTKKELEHLLWLAEEVEGEWNGSEFEKLVANIG